VHLTRPGAVRRTDHGMRVHDAALLAAEVAVVDGIAVTATARTGVDLARGRSLPQALLVLDGAARRIAEQELGVPLRLLRDPGRREVVRQHVVALLDAALRPRAGWPGTLVVRRAIPLVDPASESPLESSSRGAMIEAGIPAPNLAYAVQGASGTWYVADFAWPEHGVLGEADGTAKYGATEEAVRRALRAERRRQRDLEDAGWVVVRWDSTESQTTYLTRLRRALSLNSRPELIGNGAARDRFGTRDVRGAGLG
jgi:hypothetical protein